MIRHELDCLPVPIGGAEFSAGRPPAPRRIENGVQTEEDADVGLDRLFEALAFRRQDDVETLALAAALATGALLPLHSPVALALSFFAALALSKLAAFFVAPAHHRHRFQNFFKDSFVIGVNFEFFFIEYLQKCDNSWIDYLWLNLLNCSMVLCWEISEYHYNISNFHIWN